MAFLERIEAPYVVERCRREAWDIFKGAHRHDCYEIYYLEKGEIVHFVDEKLYTARAGDFVLIPPGKIHKTLPRHGQAHTRILIYLPASFVQPVGDENLFAGFDRILVTTGNRRVAERLLNSLLKEDAGEADHTLMRAMMTELLVYLSRWARLEQPETEEEPKNGMERKVREITEYLDAYFSQPVTLTELAERFYLNPTYLSRIFRRVTGMTYTEWLTRRRLKEAAILLNTTDYKVAEIAAAVGFHSDNHFCKMFRKHMGTSPKRFRTIK